MEEAVTQLIRVNLAPFVLVCQVSELLFQQLTYHGEEVLKVIVVLSFLIIAGQYSTLKMVTEVNKYQNRKVRTVLYQS